MAEMNREAEASVQGVWCDRYSVRVCQRQIPYENSAFQADSVEAFRKSYVAAVNALTDRTDK
ncbi:hypothetical protein ACLBOM_36445 [Escherichia coli]